jgi:hypothetical protein
VLWNRGDRVPRLGVEGMQLMPSRRLDASEPALR